MASYPLILTNLGGARVVVVGGGKVAERKVNGLIAGGATPVVISPDLTELLQRHHANGQMNWLARRYNNGDLAGALLAVAATNDRAVNAAIAAEARERGVLANISDNPTQGSWTTTATVRRGDLVIAVTTNGASPKLAAQIRRDLEARYGEEYAAIVHQLREEREH